MAPQPHERALEIAGATGYGAAVLARVLQAGYLRSTPTPTSRSPRKRRWNRAGVTNAKTVSTAAVDGWADDAPYDVILLNGAAEIVPDAWLAQLAPGGRLGVIVREGAAGAARIYTRAGDATALSRGVRCSPAGRAGLERPPSFRF